MKPIISVIVPVYNVERYLSICLDSLLNQGLNEGEYEIILVNDGSKDDSLKICNRYKASYSNIFVYTQVVNKGVSMARNLGICKARGEWIMFVDSDDYLCKGSLNYLLENYPIDQYDAIRFWTRIRSDATIDKELSCDGEIKFVGTGYDFIERYGLETFCISMMYRKSFLLDRGIVFSSYKIGEDFLFASQFLLTNPRICSTSSIVYQYLIHPNSASTSRDKNHARRCANDHLEVNKILISELNNDNIKEVAPKVFEKSIETIQGKMMLIFSRILSSNLTKEEFEEIVKEQKSLGVLPIQTGKGLKMCFSRFVINGLTYFPIFYRPLKYIYGRVFVPYILPKMDRDN